MVGELQIEQMLANAANRPLIIECLGEIQTLPVPRFLAEMHSNRWKNFNRPSKTALVRRGDEAPA
jgi:hypothetical protein